MYQCLTVTEGLYLLVFFLQGFLLQSISYPITQVANNNHLHGIRIAAALQQQVILEYTR